MLPRKLPSRYSYTERDKELARVLYEMNEGKLLETAETIGVNPGTLRKWVESHPSDKELEEERKKQRNRFIQEAWEVIHDGLSLLKKRLPQGNLKEIATIVAILVDKIHILQKVEASVKVSESLNRSISISTMSDEQLHQLLEELTSGSKRSSSPTEHRLDDEKNSTT